MKLRASFGAQFLLGFFCAGAVVGGICVNRFDFKDVRVDGITDKLGTAFGVANGKIEDVAIDVVLAATRVIDDEVLFHGNLGEESGRLRRFRVVPKHLLVTLRSILDV